MNLAAIDVSSVVVGGVYITWDVVVTGPLKLSLGAGTFRVIIYNVCVSSIRGLPKFT